ncbi:hypothetical protein G3A_12260 [Bacillus sp. 17376]|nr:hypothetical protein G3A_12260 [Bacillus sp. 17376]
MLIQNVLSAPVFLVLLFLTYISMWIYISRHEVRKENKDKH